MPYRVLLLTLALTSTLVPSVTLDEHLDNLGHASKPDLDGMESAKPASPPPKRFKLTPLGNVVCKKECATLSLPDEQSSYVAPEFCTGYAQQAQLPGGVPAILPGEQLTQIAEALEPQCIATGVEEEQHGLLADLALEADVRLDRETGTVLLQAFGQGVPVVPGENHAEMRYRRVATAHRVAAGAVLEVGLRVLVDDQLMAEEVEVDPVLGGAASVQAEDPTVETPDDRQIVNGDDGVEGHQAHGVIPLWMYRDYLPCRFRWKVHNISPE